MNTPQEIGPDSDLDMNQLTLELDKVKSKVFLGRNAAFLGSLMSSLTFYWSWDIPTAATDGENFWWNPKDFLDLPPKERGSTIEHELWHVARLHMMRCGTKDPKIWNIACDIRINRDLRADGHVLPPPMWIQQHPECPHEAEEDIYDWLSSQSKSSQAAMGAGNSAGTHVVPGNPKNPQTVINNVVKAIHQAKASNQAGNLPGGMEETINRFLAPVVPWQSLLQRFFTEMLDDDYTWRRPNRRFDPQSLYLPSRFTDDGRLEKLNYYLDVSGSISNSDLVRFNSEVKHIKDTYNPEELNLIQFDTRITEVVKITENDQFDEIKIHGRGGTCLRCVREHIIETKPTAAVIFSDMCVTPMEPLPHEIPIIWVSIGNTGAKVPFGQLIHIKA